MKKKPLFLAALIFGGLGLLIIGFSIIMYMVGNTSVFQTIGNIFGMARNKITSSTLCQFGIILESAAFLLGYRSLADET